MSTPFFYIDSYVPSQPEIILDEDTSRHIVQVLRMKKEEVVNLTDGKGNLVTSSILDDHKKHCTVVVRDIKYTAPPARKITIGISLLKNTDRFEWFLEKATEIGVSEIIPLLCARTEKEKFRRERLHQICISAMLQSQQTWLPQLPDPQKIDTVIMNAHQQQKFIAHCMEGTKSNLRDLVNESLSSQIILIGPEGDFTTGEVEQALQCHFIGASLGETRLRTETAGIVAAALLCNP
jgi:16S rRNA (uracil1498-N3)-methyltransferase